MNKHFTLLKTVCSQRSTLVNGMDPDQLASLVKNVDPDQLVSEEASWSGSTLFSMQDVSS